MTLMISISRCYVSPTNQSLSDDYPGNTHRRAKQQQRACHHEHLMVRWVGGPLGQQRPDSCSEHQQRETLPTNDQYLCRRFAINGPYHTRVPPVALRGALPCPEGCQRCSSFWTCTSETTKRMREPETRKGTTGVRKEESRGGWQKRFFQQGSYNREVARQLRCQYKRP